MLQGASSLLAPFILGVVATVQTVAAQPPLSFNRDIRPILSDNCFSCHGPDSAARKADLRLDRREVAIQRSAVVPGDSSSSKIVERITSSDASQVMPPPETKKVLTSQQKEMLARWIQEGAPYEPHWSLIAPVRPTLPEVTESSWIRNPIDRFVLARLERAGLKHAPESDRRALVRRVSLDLTGLPPSPDVVDRFVNDKSPDGYERLVDSLMMSPNWGEHRARYWLDAARYADTHGIHFDNYREMWSYRDWVISALNRNLPFDEFTIENLAGDLVPNATVEQQVGSGFNRCNITTNEGGSIEEECLVLHGRDRVETTSQVWLGLTAGCAVCHDHKFDPLTQKEFYQLSAYFNNTTQAGLDGNVKDTPPILRIISNQDRQRWQELEKALPELSEKLSLRRKALRPVFDQWLASSATDVHITLPAGDVEFKAPLDDDSSNIRFEARGEIRQSGLETTSSWQPGRTGTNSIFSNHGKLLTVPGACDFDLDQPFTCACWIKLRNSDPMGAILSRIDEDQALRGWDLWTQDRRIAMHLIHQWPVSALRVMTAGEIPLAEWFHVAIAYNGNRKASGVSIYVNGRKQKTVTLIDELSGTTRNGMPLTIGARTQSSPMNGLGMEDCFIYRRALTEDEICSLMDVRVAKLAAPSIEKRNERALDCLFDWWCRNKSTELIDLESKYATLQAEQSELRVRSTVAHVMHEKPQTAAAYVLYRGEYDQRREKVEPDTPSMLPPFPHDLPRNRLGFARWLLLPENPLTARVAVNRFWSEIFGTGMVRTVGDFGVQGELPSNQDLLDWLAIEFRESKWDVKKLFRLIVTSATYRQASVSNTDSQNRDPDNRLLSRGPHFRMDAEMIRDYALFASGLLSPKIGGPSVRTYQPPGVWEAVAMVQSNTGNYQRDVHDAAYRRSLYTFWKRAAPPPSMDIFNAPSREVCTVVRERTNTPLQALVTMNDVQFIEAARVLAERAIHSSPSVDDRIDYISQRLLSRPLSAEETAVVKRSLHLFEQRFEKAHDAASKLCHAGDSQPDRSIRVEELASWTMLASQLLNLNEVLNK